MKIFCCIPPKKGGYLLGHKCLAIALTVSINTNII